MYSIEKIATTQAGHVFLGTIPGYEPQALSATLAEVKAALELAHQDVKSRGLGALNPFVVQGTQLGSISNPKYEESVYDLRFAKSPRMDAPILADEFSRTLDAYASFLGNHFKQERVYVEYNGLTKILKMHKP